jgi:GR25 family glycosyltransferase involved in LPS biosynthesis
LHVHVINLDRNPDRLAEFRSVNRHLTGLSRAVAFDGAKLDLAELARQRLISTDIRHPDYYSVGGVGLAMSHIALWDLAIKTGTVLTVAEDDAIFHARFDACASRRLGRDPVGVQLRPVHVFRDAARGLLLSRAVRARQDA